MAFNDDIIFPTKLAYGSRRIVGGREVRKVITGSGRVYTQTRRSVNRDRWDISYAIKTYEELQDVQAVYDAVGHELEGFLFTDPIEFSSAADRLTAITKDDQVIGTSTASTAENFQLVKNTTEGSKTYARTIYKPKASPTPLIAVGGVLQTDPTDYTIDLTTGIVAGTTSMDAGQVTAGYEFYVPVMFAQEDFGMIYANFNHGALDPIILTELINL
jgi:uncharacterized protein (TIGR02217 family)